MEVEEEEFESHFVENPFIKLREKTSQKHLDSKAHLSVNTLANAEKD